MSSKDIEKYSSKSYEKECLVRLAKQIEEEEKEKIIKAKASTHGGAPKVLKLPSPTKNKKIGAFKDDDIFV